MDALTFNNNNPPNDDSNYTRPDELASTDTKTNLKNQQQPSTGTNKIGSEASPRNFDSNYYDPDQQQQQNGQPTETNQGSGGNQYNTQLNTNNGGVGVKKDDVTPRTGRADSLSFYTNFNNGPRFSTDSNSSISNFLNLPTPADQGFNYDSNGRGYSILNNMFLPPGQSQSQQGGQGPTQNQASNQQSQQQPGQNFIPSGDYATYQSFRRPSEQLEPFNPSVKLKAPNFSNKSSNTNINQPSNGNGGRNNSTYLPGTSFSEGVTDFDSFSKRDSYRNSRIPSFLNNNTFGEGSDFDFFAKRDSIKPINDEELALKDNTAEDSQQQQQKGKKETKSEPDTNQFRPEPLGSIPECPQSSMNKTPQQQQDYNQYEQQPQQQQQQFRQPQLPFNEFQQQTPQTQQYQQQQVPQQFQFNQQQQPNEDELSPKKAKQQKRKNPSQDMTGGRKRRPALQPPAQPSAPPPTAVNASTVRSSELSPQYNMSPSTQHSHISPASSQYSNTSENQRLIPVQDAVTTEDGRPLLGATKVDQLMLVIQARRKGVHNPIPQADDGSILDNGDGVLPQQTDLVGGIDKPKSKGTKQHECQYCHKQFTQSTHLEVHVRSHIGYKPFECNFCGKRFTQGGNLRTHLRLHTGEKPYVCETCGRSFSRKGNLAAHKLTHENLKPYECKLDGCNKAFTQLGNLKAHQNRFHLETLNNLTRRLAEIDPEDEHTTMNPDERELLNYFAGLYKNSNRGIKGRGKRTSPTITQQLAQPSQQHIAPQPQQVPAQPSQPYNQQFQSQYQQYPPQNTNFNQNIAYNQQNGGNFTSSVPSTKNGNISFKNVNYNH